MSRHDKIIPESLYNLSAGGLCGVYVPCKVMRKIAREMANHSARVKRILADNKDALRAAHWTCANKYSESGASIDKQVIVRFALKHPDKWNGVDRHIDLFKPPQPEYMQEVYLVDDYAEASRIAEEILAEQTEGEK